MLTLRVSASALDPDVRGVSVYSKGIWHENTLAGCEGKEMSNYIFGDIDIPALDEDDGPVAAFDVSRSMTLNPANDLVRALYSFLGANVEQLRKELVDQERERKRTEESKRLAREADEIAKLLNEDFADYRRQLAQTKAKLKGARDAGPTEEGGDTGEDLIFGGESPAAQLAETGSPGSEGEQATETTDGGRNLLPQVAEHETAPPQGKPAGAAGRGKRRPRGGFGVDFKHMGKDAQRATYDRDSRIIAINLDHPQFDSKVDLSARIEDPGFRKLAYEIAVTEYAFALAYELAAVGHFGGEETDALYEVQEVLDRVIRRAARVHEN